MFGVFYKGTFQGLWHNQKDDNGWIRRTCVAMGWPENDVEVYWYQWNFDARTVYIFDDEKNLLVQGQVMIEIQGESTVEQVPGWGTVANIPGERHLP